MTAAVAGAAENAAAVAASLERFAALIGAGCDEATAWRVVAEGTVSTHDRRMLELFAETARRHESVAAVIAATAAPASAWHGVAALLRLCERWGAPPSASAAALAAVLRDRAETQRTLRTALAGPRATARLLAWLPWVTAAGGMLLGADTLAVYGSPLGMVLIVVGAVLAFGFRAMAARILRRAEPPGALAGLHHDLAAALLATGVPASTAIDEARAAVPEQWLLEADEVELGVLRAERAGAPVAQLLRAESDEARRRARARALVAVERAGVRLMLPLGALLLPSFIVLGVVPLVLALLS